MDRNRDRDRHREDDRTGREEEGYGRAAMSGRDYSESGRFFSEDEERGGRFGERTSQPFTERSYNAGGYGRGRHQDDFYTPGRATSREGDRVGYGPAPSDDYERHGYGQEDRRTGRGEGSTPGRGEFRDARYAMFDRSQFNEEDSTGPRHLEVDRYGSGDADISRSVDEHYSSAYRRGQAQRGGQYDMAGPHSGRGPKGYQRSPERIKEEICERLTHHGHLDATDVDVKVESGEVTLSGTVDSRQAKRLAEELAESVPGVRDVHNQLRIARTGSEGSGDGLTAPAQLGSENRGGEQPKSQGGPRGSRRSSQP